ncbi:hypothetical protein Lal_00004965, partial [Lupinus albus]
MAFRYRSVSQPTFSFIKTTFTKSSTNAKASASFINNTRSSTTLPRQIDCSTGLCAVIASLVLCCVISTPHILSRHRFEKLEIANSGYALQCQPWSLISS